MLKKSIISIIIIFSFSSLLVGFQLYELFSDKDIAPKIAELEKLGYDINVTYLHKDIELNNYLTMKQDNTYYKLISAGLHFKKSPGSPALILSKEEELNTIKDFFNVLYPCFISESDSDECKILISKYPAKSLNNGYIAFYKPYQ
jgi:hypothetical protein